MTEQNVLDSIHNCVYFAVEVLQNIQRSEVHLMVSPILKYKINRDKLESSTLDREINQSINE